MTTYDYIIVGAGSAGCVLANRLSADPACRVLLIEAGGSARAIRIRAPALYNLLWRTKYDWELYTEPQKKVDDRKMYWPRGKVLGGTSCLNAMVYIRGHKSSYDEWRDAGCDGWGYDDVLPYFKKSEDYRGPASKFHGTGGSLTVTPPSDIAPVSEAFIEAASKHHGVAVSNDFNGEKQEGIGRFHHTVRDGERCSTSMAFLEPARSRQNLQILTGATVTGIVLEGKTAKGVRLLENGREKVLHTDGEVILSGGAIGSPHLLLLSGIGPAAQLREKGIDVVADIAGVGQNLQDHLLTVVAHETRENGSTKLSLPALLSWIARFAVTGGGPGTRPPVECGGFVKTSAEQTRPDLQYHFVPFGVDSPNTDEKRDPPVGRIFSICPSLIYPRSRGQIRLGTNSPLDSPAIDPAYFSDDSDMQLLVEGVKAAREIAALAPLSRYRGAELSPGPDAKTDDDIRASIRTRLNTIFHPVGTCKMGTDEEAVVDPQLKVRGVDGLRVVDGAVLPNIIGGNTNAPIIMIAEKAADMILAN